MDLRVSPFLHLPNQYGRRCEERAEVHICPWRSSVRKCIAGSKIPVDLERATSRIWSYALQAERKAVMYEVRLGDRTASCFLVNERDG